MASAAFGSNAATSGGLLLFVRTTVMNNTPRADEPHASHSVLSKQFPLRLNFGGRRGSATAGRVRRSQARPK